MNVTEIKFTNFSSTEREELKKQLRQELAEEIIDSKRCKTVSSFANIMRKQHWRLRGRKMIFSKSMADIALLSE